MHVAWASHHLAHEPGVEGVIDNAYKTLCAHLTIVTRVPTFVRGKILSEVVEKQHPSAVAIIEAKGYTLKQILHPWPAQCPFEHTHNTRAHTRITHTHT